MPHEIVELALMVTDSDASVKSDAQAEQVRTVWLQHASSVDLMTKAARYCSTMGYSLEILTSPMVMSTAGFLLVAPGYLSVIEYEVVLLARQMLVSDLVEDTREQSRRH